ncbi:MAG: TMEM175 family protein [Rhodanobacter sp.]
MSFVYVGIYWNNHHQMLAVSSRVWGAVSWENLALLFWLSLFPIVTGWTGESRPASGKWSGWYLSDRGPTAGQGG